MARQTSESAPSVWSSTKVLGVPDVFDDLPDRDRCWMRLAACVDAPSDTFFFENVPALQRQRLAEARAFCDVCVVRERCLEMALTNREGQGIWGGCTPLQRKKILRDRRRLAL